MRLPPPASAEAIKIARVLRALGAGPMQRQQAQRAAQLLGVHWTTVYRLRARFLRDPVASALTADLGGRRGEPCRLPAEVEAVVADVLEQWLPGSASSPTRSSTPTWR